MTESFIEVSSCEDCGEKTYHLPLPMPAVSFDNPEGFYLHLDEDEAMTLYLELKEVLLHQ